MAAPFSFRQKERPQLIGCPFKGTPFAENVFLLLAGIGLVAFSFLNVQYQLVRRWVKRLGWLGSFPDTKVARVFYGGVFSCFALVIGQVWITVGLTALLQSGR